MGKNFDISRGYAGRTIKKIGFSYKKTCAYLEASQKKRDKCLEKIKYISIENHIYIDKIEIDSNRSKERVWSKKNDY